MIPSAPSSSALSPEAIGGQLRQAFPGVRITAVSLHDSRGDALWLGDGDLAEEETRLVAEALDAFALEAKRQVFDRQLSDGRIGMMFPARDPRGRTRGMALVIAEARTLDGNAQEKALAPALQSVLRRLSLLLRSSDKGTTDDTSEATVASRTLSGTLGSTLTGTLSASAIIRGYVAPPEFAHLQLYVQQLLRLRTSGGTRRYEVLLRSRSSGGEVSSVAPVDLLNEADGAESKGALDRFVLTNLITWLQHNRAALEADPASFSVNLSAGALADDSFLEFMKTHVREAKLPPKMLGFEIRESACREQRPQVERFISTCERIGCHIVIDDFTLDSQALPLLRHKAVRLVKIDAQLTSSAMKDKLSQAIVVAIAQAAKVLGTHCVAKRIDSSMARQWLAAIGVDFAQGFLLEGPLPLATLSAAQDEPPRAAVPESR